MPSLAKAKEQTGLLSLPVELVHNVLLELPPLSIEHFSQTCKLARRYVYGLDNQGDIHLWKRLYLQRFDFNESLWPSASQPTSPSHNSDSVREDANNDQANVAQLTQSSLLGITRLSSPSIMSLVQTRERASRLYRGDPLNHVPMASNFDSVLSALLSVLDTAILEAGTTSCNNSNWLDTAIIAVNKANWAEWIFPRICMDDLADFKSNYAELLAARAALDTGSSKRRRLVDVSEQDQDQDQGQPNRADSGPSNHSSSRSRASDRPSSNRRRSARLLKLIYPEALHGLIDQGIDIDAVSPPRTALAARLHCLHGIRTWKNSQRQRLTDSPQEILASRNGGDPIAVDVQTQDGPTPEATVPTPGHNHEATNTTSASTEAAWMPPADAQTRAGTSRDTVNAVPMDDSDNDDEVDSLDDPTADMITSVPQMFGPSFGFCASPDQEDSVRAAMRHRVYDSGYYGWENGYAPLHSWRIRPPPDPADREQEEGQNDNGYAARHHDATDALRGVEMGWGSDDGDDDAMRDALGDSDDDIPDDAVPIEIEASSDEDHRPTFRLADRQSNVVASSTRSGDPTAGWDDSGDEVDVGDGAPDQGEGGSRGVEAATRAARPARTSIFGTFDEDTRTYTYRGDLPVAIGTGPHEIQVTVGDYVDFGTNGELHVRLIRSDQPPQRLRVTSDGAVTGSHATLGLRILSRTPANEQADPTDHHPADEDLDEVDDDDDDDYDADAWDADDDAYDAEDDLGFESFFDADASVPNPSEHAGSYARKEIITFSNKTQAQDGGNSDASADADIQCLRIKTVYWELVEAIMVVMFANLKEAIWLENWGVGIKLPKVFDAQGALVHDPMEKREFLNFPTGWISSLANALPERREAQPSDTAGVGESATGDAERKPRDWARCESFWAGTYAFLDYSNFVFFNARMSRRRREIQARLAALKTKGEGESTSPRGIGPLATREPSLLGQEEAVGDCLQLRMELVPGVESAADEGQPEDPEYPTLHFRGTTLTYWGNDPPMPRGGVYGRVRPVYAPEQTGPRPRIDALHWSLTHVYDGEDRWQLEGIQPGPPGTKAPIFGIWTDAAHDAESPNGPFVYWMMDERPWKLVDELNRRERERERDRAPPRPH